MESPSLVLESTVKEKNNESDMLNSLLITAQQEIQSDWKSKSLDPKPIEKYTIELKQDIPQVQEVQTEEKPSMLKRIFGKKQQKKQAVSKTQRSLPQPKIAKVNDRIFCMAIDSEVKIYFYNKDPKIKRMFDMIDYSASEPIQFVFGNNTEFVFIGHKHKLTVLQLERKQGKIKYEIIKVQHIKINNLKRCTHHGKYLYALSSDEIYEFQTGSNTLVQKKLMFSSPEDQKIFDQLQPIQLVTQNQKTLFFFGTKKDERTLIDMKGNNTTSDPKKKECECLTLVRFTLSKTNKLLSELGSQKKSTPELENSIEVTLFPIDHVFDTGIFMKSKVFVLQNEMFLMELYEEVILIKKHFEKYIVWDNISILSSKSSEKKGQLVLADKRIMVYSEIGQIYAYDIYFNNQQSKLNMPAIDSFKGNQNDDEVLYDAVLLRYSAQTLMKVLFYFKEFDIARPKSRVNYGGDEKKDGKLNLSIISIVQSDPKQKLLDLLIMKKSEKEVQQFVKRFRISELEKYKSQWTVSKKTIKDIENNLLQIEDDKYIQEQLDKILKEKPHDLNFLTIVEKKQIQRLKRLLVRNLLKMNSVQDQLPSEIMIKEAEKKQNQQVAYINQVIQWLMESMMYLKKLSYSKNFLSFKEYDFIEIGKLKAASLKEQIKLLTCKKFEKRLKYFLNSFKFLAIANYQDIFTFLLQNKSVQQLQQFILSFKFIMPNFVETSEVFIRKRRPIGDSMIPNGNINNFLVANKQSVVLGQNENQGIYQNCELWDQSNEQSNNQVAQTLLLSSNPGQSKAPRVAESFSNVENFEKMIVEEIQIANIDCNNTKIDDQRIRFQAASNFKRILSNFVESNWFKNSAFKQHATLSISTKELYEKFYQLKNDGVFNLFIKIVYKKIREQIYQQSKVQSILDHFVHHKVLPQSFRKNVQCRVQVYKIIERQNAAKSTRNPFMSMNFRRDMNLREDFLIMREDYFFQYLIIEYRNLVLKDIKDSYEKIQPCFFRERFQIFLNSPLIDLKKIIGFMDEFVENPDDSIRLDVFKCIKSHLKLNDFENAKKFNEKSLDKSIFPEQSLILDELKEQAKIPYGFYFYSFWNALRLEMTYQDLVKATHCPILENNTFIKTIIGKYSREQYNKDSNNSTLITFIEGLSLDKIQPIDINENPLGFFGLMLYMLDTLSFKVERVSVFNLLVQSYLNNNSFQILRMFVRQFSEFSIDQCNVPTRNFELLADFKQDNYVNKILSDRVIQWVQQSYKGITSQDEITPTFENIDNALALITQFSKEGIIEREKAFLEMLKIIRKFDSKLLLDIEFLRSELSQTGFTFMIHLIAKGDLSILKNKPAQQIEDHIYNFYCIYSNFKEASKGQIVDSMQSTELCKFFNELCHKLIKCKYYLPAQRILFKVVGSPVYFRDIVFAFLAEMQYIPSQERKQFIRDFLQTQTTSLLKKKVTEITEKVKDFEKDPAYFKSSANGVFKDILQNRKPVEAFFFLIRLPELHLMQSASEINEIEAYKKVDMSSYLMLTAYVRCLQQHLSMEFYPSIQFFKSKLDMLHAQMDRMDVIKDINIAISRLKDISIENFESEEKKFSVSKDQSELQFFYKRFMESIGLNPQVRLTQEDFLQASKRIERYSRHIPQEVLVKKTQDEADARVDLKSNQEKFSRVKRQNKAEVIEKEVAATITQAKRTAEKYTKMIGQRTPISKKNIAQRTQQEMEKIRKREQHEIQSVKQSFKSSTTQRVNELIDSLRKKRNHAIADSRVSEYQKSPISEMHTPTRTQSRPVQIANSRTPVEPKNKQEQSTKSRRKDLQSSRSQKEKQLELQRIQREKAQNKQKQGASKAPDAIFGLISGFGIKKTEKVQNKVPQRVDSFPNTLSNESIHTKFSGQSQYAVKVTSPHESIKKIQPKQESFLPVTIIGKMFNDPSISVARKSQKQKKQQSGDSENSSISDNLSELRKRIQSRKQQEGTGSGGSFKKKINFKDLEKLFNQKEPQAVKYLPKIDMIKSNMKVGSELLKRVYSCCLDFQNFFKFIEYMVYSDSKFKQIIEQKSLIIVNQMEKMKGNINLKQILPVQLFITPNRSNIKDYYSFAFEMIKPNMIKVLQKPDANIHGLAVMIRYGFGAENSVYYQVYEEYIRVLLKDYQINKVDDRKTFLLAQKMKNIYPNMNPENRQGKFVQIIQDMRDRQKKQKLVKSLHGALSKRSDISGQNNQEFSHTVTELMRKLKI